MKTRYHDNNFNLIRLIAAWLILFGHSFTLYNLSDDPLISYLQLPSSSFYALACFFTISGYLVTASWQRNPRLVPYTLNRVLRIVPALAIVTLLSICVIGPMVTSLPLEEYFKHSDTWKYLRNIHVFGMRYSLPGTFDTLPYPNIVNGSLWSLKLEIQCYIMLALLGVAGILRPPIILAATAGYIACYALLQYIGENPPSHILGLKYNNLKNFILWGFFFWAGSCLRFYRDHIHYSTGRIIAVSILAFALYYLIPQKYSVSPHMLCLPYMIIGIALHIPTIGARIFRQHDISYGIYLYAFPIQQLYMHYIGTSYGMGGFIICSTALTCGAAMLSWHLIEQSALRLKPSRLQKPQ